MLTNVIRTPTIAILTQSVRTEKDLTTALAIMDTQGMVSIAQVRLLIFCLIVPHNASQSNIILKTRFT